MSVLLLYQDHFFLTVYYGLIICCIYSSTCVTHTGAVFIYNTPLFCIDLTVNLTYIRGLDIVCIYELLHKK